MPVVEREGEAPGAPTNMPRVPLLGERREGEGRPEEHDVRRAFRNVGGGVDGDPDVGRVQGDRVVDPVAEEGHVRAGAPGHLDQPRLLIGGDPPEDRRPGDRGGERIVVEAIEVSAAQGAVDGEPDVATDLGGDAVGGPRGDGDHASALLEEALELGVGGGGNGHATRENRFGAPLLTSVRSPSRVRTSTDASWRS
jgi:hypothetical protein